MQAQRGSDHVAALSPRRQPLLTPGNVVVWVLWGAPYAEVNQNQGLKDRQMIRSNVG